MRLALREGRCACGAAPPNEPPTRPVARLAMSTSLANDRPTPGFVLARVFAVRAAWHGGPCPVSSSVTGPQHKKGDRGSLRRRAAVRW